MAALVTNIARPDPTDPSSWTAAIVGGADLAMPVSAGGFIGINGSQCQSFENGGTSLVAGSHYSIWTGNFPASASYDISGVGQAFHIHFRNNAPFFTSIAENSDSIWLIAFSGGSSTDYARWEFDGSAGFKNGSWHIISTLGTPDFETGGYDNTDITGIGMAIESLNTDVFGFQMAVDQLLYINGPVVFEDTGAAATVSLQDYVNELLDFNNDFHSLLVKQAGPVAEFAFPISFQCDDYSDSTESMGIAFRAADGIGFRAAPLGYYQLEYIGQASGSMIINNGALSTTSVDFDLTINGAAASTVIDVNTALVAGVRNVAISGSGTDIDNMTIIGPDDISLADAILTASTISGSAVPVDLDADLQASSITITNSTGDDLNLNFAPVDISNISFTMDAGSTINHNSTAGTWTMDVSSSGQVNFDTLNANDVTFTVDSALNANDIDPSTGGGTVTIDNAVSVDVTVTVTDVTDGSPVQNARVRLVAAAGGPETVGTVILSGVTNASGVLTASYTFTGNQPVTGTVRQAANVPYMKPGSLTGSITSTGYNVPVTLVRD